MSHVQLDLALSPLAPSSSRPAIEGAVAFASAEAQMQRTAELLGEGALVVTIALVTAALRGSLAEYVDEQIEGALAARGAPSPYMSAWSAVAGVDGDPEARLADQIFRARSVGASGLAIAMASLAACATPTLTPEDSAFLRALVHMSERAPLVLLLDDGDERLPAYAAPIALARLVQAKPTTTAEPAPPPVSEARIVSSIDMADAIVAMEDAVTDVSSIAVTTDPAESAPHVDDELPPPPPLSDIPLVPPPDFNELACEPEIEGEPMEDEEALVEEEPPAPRTLIASPAPPANPGREGASTVGIPVVGPNDFWRGWALQLAAARGPQPLAAFERLFVESYMPLASAIAEGVDDPRALRAYDEFRRNFERSYTDAFQTFGATNRRPRLVMDAHELASKQARLHNARAAHVIVVDSMRYDLGIMVRDAFAHRAEGNLSLTAETLVFSALPTTTMRQLETIARGIDALRAPAADDGTESLRGRSAETVRRLRVGSREIWKLDLIPVMLSSLAEPAHGSSADVVAGFDEIADTVADALVRHVETLAPRTLLLVMGDHGFVVDRRGSIQMGGASPEEVMVPAFAFLAGDLH